MEKSRPKKNNIDANEDYFDEFVTTNVIYYLFRTK
jgi:hypothetical protein